MPAYSEPSSSNPTEVQDSTVTQEPQNAFSSPETWSAIIGTVVAATSVLLLPLSKAASKRIEKGTDALETEKINEIAKLVQAESEREKAESERVKAVIVQTIAEQSLAEDAILEIRENLKSVELEASEVSKPIKSAIEGLVRSYHSQALRQSAVQFYFSVAAASVGFGLIIYSGISAVNTDNPKRLLNTLPGAVISGVSALFFKQAEETRKRATDLYDRLRSDEKQSQAIEIASGIESQEFRSLVQAQLVLHLADVKDAQPIDFGSQLSKLIALRKTPDDEITEGTH